MLTELSPQAVESATSTEVTAKPRRRQFTAAYKLKVLRKIDSCKSPGEVGAVIRSEGLYSSMVSKWRQQGKAGKLGKKRGRRENLSAVPEREVESLRRENARLKKRLKQAELIIDTQKKFAELLSGSADEPSSEES